MVKLGLFCVCLPIGMMELLFYHQFSILILGGLYLGLVLQAESAAERFLREGLRPAGKTPDKAPEPENAAPPPEEEVPLRVHRLGPRRPPPKSAEAAPAEPLVRPLPSAPKFGGRAHEVLGVGENARTRTIVTAFRHWIKRFHPDHASGSPAALANEKVRALTSARDSLLERRRGRKAA